MIASVRAGRSLAQAIEDGAEKRSGPVAQGFGVISGEYRLGGASVEEALRRTRDRLKVENFTMLSSALIIHFERGCEMPTMLQLSCAPFSVPSHHAPSPGARNSRSRRNVPPK